MRRTAAWALAALAFTLLATANAAGYRYGASDQAFYVPVVLRALDPGAFPRDAGVIDAQGHLMLADEIIASIVRVTGASLESLFLAGYLLSLVLTVSGLVLIGDRVYGNRWLTAALGAAFTLRHRIPRTSANSFEPYFHPRMLAFAIGTLALAALLRGRHWLAVAAVAVMATIHITTAIWFACLLGLALAVLDARWRTLAAGAAAGGAVFLAWAVTAGPLGRSLMRMDDLWLQAVASKDSLFPTDWPAWAWVANLALLVVTWLAHADRTRRGVARPEDRALAFGAAGLVAVFLLTLPLVAARLALPTQLQISRVFWLVDVLATVYVLAVIGERAGRKGVRALAVLLVIVSAGRGSYIMLVEHPERALFEVGLPRSPWQDAMNWIAEQPLSTHVFADPGHAWKYGSSVRVAAGRDVLLEEVKDSAMAIYSRDVAVRVVERAGAVGDFAAITPEQSRALAARYDLDLLVTEADLRLPLLYRNEQFRVYSLSR